ncbi:hypothetical protein E2C01_090073 [Portunus trituberculatus]|uniref:Uncharacterized protein n=1 Tax=Portunus trituberculatus TaxID=210409 RepID=A0A5B7JKF3_PORTR|nr:hypothetical protein [Portunus trituberculatus]
MSWVSIIAASHYLVPMLPHLSPTCSRLTGSPTPPFGVPSRVHSTSRSTMTRMNHKRHTFFVEKCKGKTNSKMET